MKQNRMFAKLIDAIDSGTKPTFQFRDAIDDLEPEVDPNCCGDLVGYNYHGKEGEEGYCIELRFDTTEYMDFNRTQMKPTYYDKYGEPTLQAPDSPVWPSDNVVGVWFDAYTTPMKYMKELPTVSQYLRAEWKQENIKNNEKDTYTTFLEKKVMKAREFVDKF